MKCRSCNNQVDDLVLDLDSAPPSNSIVRKQDLDIPESYLPLRLYLCTKCFLVQLDEVKSAHEIFDDNYAYFSSYSSTWLDHCATNCTGLIQRFSLSKDSLVIEIASNDGYMLQFFRDRDIPVLGIEPTKNTAAVAIEKGIDTIIDFFCKELANDLAERGRTAELVIANNVLAHVPNLNDFVSSLRIILKPNGIAVIEFPHLFRLMKNRQFDTIYHEHYSYFSLSSVKKVFENNGLFICDVDQISTHGGSLRIYVKDCKYLSAVNQSVERVLQQEREEGMLEVGYYTDFSDAVVNLKRRSLEFIYSELNRGKSFVGYGAAAKASTITNYYGLGKDVVEYIVDKNPNKIGKYMPGTHIPIIGEDALKKSKPDYVIVFPWNIEQEVRAQINYIREWKANFVTLIPDIRIY